MVSTHSWSVLNVLTCMVSAYLLLVSTYTLARLVHTLYSITNSCTLLSQPEIIITLIVQIWCALKALRYILNEEVQLYLKLIIPEIICRPAYTVESLLKDSLDKGHRIYLELHTKDTF